VAKTAKSVSDLWLTRPAAALLLGCSITQFGGAVVPRLDAKHKRKDGRKDLFYGPAVVDAWLLFKLAGERVKGEAIADDDDFGEFPSPALERQRSAKADLLEIELGKQRAELIVVDQWREAVRPIYATFKRFGETLQRAYGRDAAVLHNEFVDDLQEAMRQSQISGEPWTADEMQTRAKGNDR
jgi:hypothetical protein